MSAGNIWSTQFVVTVADAVLNGTRAAYVYRTHPTIMHLEILPVDTVFSITLPLRRCA